MPNGDFLGPEAYPPGTYPAPTGVVIDGALCQLEGEPPIARPGSWGDLSWSRRRWF